MENPNRNEMLIKLGGVDILLRPSFENIAAMEAKLGGLPYLAFKFSSHGKNSATLSDCAQIIYFNQAAVNPNDPTKKKLSLDEVWELVSQEGVNVLQPVMAFLARLTAGNKMAQELTDAQKKS